MKKITIILLVLILFSCSSEDIPNQQINNTCYQIVTVGDDIDIDFITIKVGSYQYQKYLVSNYKDYIGKKEICDLSKLKQIPL